MSFEPDIPVRPPCPNPNAPAIYLAGATHQIYLEFTLGRRVLETFAAIAPGAEPYRPMWKSALLDSGAFSAHMSGVTIDIEAYRAFVEARPGFYDAVAALDVISDWKASVANWRKMEDVGAFPTFHEGEPWELLRDYAEEQAKTGGWLGFGAQRPIIRQRLIKWLAECRDVVGELAPAIHVHGWGLTMYSTVYPFASTDSTAWLMNTRDLMQVTQLNHLTKRELMDLAYARLERAPVREQWDPGWVDLVTRAEAEREKLDPDENALLMFGGDDDG